jgi:hypothetical protein
MQSLLPIATGSPAGGTKVVIDLLAQSFLLLCVWLAPITHVIVSWLDGIAIPDQQFFVEWIREVLVLKLFFISS